MNLRNKLNLIKGLTSAYALTYALWAVADFSAQIITTEVGEALRKNTNKNTEMRVQEKLDEYNNLSPPYKILRGGKYLGLRLEKLLNK